MKSKRSTDSKKFLQSFRLSLSASFLFLCYFAYRYSYFTLDLSISRSLQSIHQPLFSLLMNLVSEIGDDFHLALIGGLVIMTLFFYHARRQALLAAGWTTLSALVGTGVKYLVHRPRPDTDLVQIQELVTGKSFPSLHVLVFTVFFGYLFYLAIFSFKKFWPRVVIASVSAFLILSIGVSRIFLGAHWASDVLGGYLLGALFISYIIYRDA